MPAVAELLGSGRIPHEGGELSGRHLTENELDILRSAVSGFGRQTALPTAKAAQDELSPFEARAGALEILAAIGLCSDIELAIAVASPPDRSTAEAQRLLSRLERTLEKIAKRDRTVPKELDRLLRSVPPEIAAPLVRGIASAGDPAALPTLTKRLARDDDLALHVLSEIGRAARNAPRPLDDLLLQEVRSHLESIDPLFVRAAAQAIAELRDFGATNALVELLASPSPMLQEASWLALHALSGMAYGKEPSLWQAWHEREKRWFETHSTALFQDLESTNAGRVIKALGALAGHRYRCDELAANVTAVLDHPSPAVRRQACSTLASLGSVQSLNELVPRLDDSDPAVANAAWQALRSVSGEDLPLDRAAWEKARLQDS